MITEQTISHQEIEEDLDKLLGKIRAERKPTTRGIMLLTNFLGCLMLNTSNLNKDQLTSAELLFWLEHNGDGTPIAPIHSKA